MASAEVPTTNSVAVYLVRHGERADEAEKRRHTFVKKQSVKEKIDPELTEKGFEQARSAFLSLSSAYSVPSEPATEATKKALLFSSPLRRTIGTALMACYGQVFNTELPTVQTGDQSAQETTDDKANVMSRSMCIDNDQPANIVVMNGLCDCAAAVVKAGGSTSAVARGLVDCAAVDTGSQESAIGGSLIPTLAEIDSKFYRIQENDNTTDPMRSVQLWREADPNDVNGVFLPMTPPFRMGSFDEQLEGTGSSQHRFHTPSPGKRNTHFSAVEVHQDRKISTSQAGSTGADTFLGAVNRAAYLTAKAGSDICIIVTHREGIRYLAREVCGYKRYSGENRHLSTPYCCIGTFIATVKMPSQSFSHRRGSCSVKWSFCGVAPFEEFRVTSHPPSLANFTSDPVELSIEIAGHDPHVLCYLRPLEGSKEQTLIPKKLVISCCAGSCYSGAETVGNLSRFDIVDGKRNLARFLHMLRTCDKAAAGVLLGSDGDGETATGFVLNVSDQPALPCPPSSLCIAMVTPYPVVEATGVLQLHGCRSQGTTSV